MKRLVIRSLAAAIVFLTAADRQSQASYMNWDYTTASTPPVLTSGTGSVQLTGVKAGTAALSIPLLGVQDSSTAAAGSPDVYNSPFKVAMTITDKATNATGTLNLSGTLSGSLTSTTSSLVAAFSGPSSLTLGGHVYTANVPNLSLSGSGLPQQNLMANITVADTSSSPPPPPHITPNVVTPSTPSSQGGGSQGASNNPEPTSLLLGGLGWSLLGVGGWWKRARRPMPHRT